MLYAGQFFFQWLSLFLFTLEYLSTEQEVRKVLGLKSTKRKREIVAAIGVVLLICAVIVTFLICYASGVSFFDSWASSLGQTCVAGALLFFQAGLINQIHKTIKISDLDLVAVKRTFFANLSVIGFIFIVQCGELVVNIIADIVVSKSSAEQSQANSTTFLFLSTTIQILLLTAYFTFFLLLFRATKGGKTYEDLILHKEVPELVYLQTRKLLRDVHYKRASLRVHSLGAVPADHKEDVVDDLKKGVQGQGQAASNSEDNHEVFNPNL